MIGKEAAHKMLINAENLKNNSFVRKETFYLRYWNNTERDRNNNNIDIRNVFSIHVNGVAEVRDRK